MPLTTSHSQIESQIESFVEHFKKNGSVFINNLTVDSCGASTRLRANGGRAVTPPPAVRAWAREERTSTTITPPVVCSRAMSVPLNHSYHHGPYSNNQSTTSRRVSSSYGSSCYDSSSCEDGPQSDTDETMEEPGSSGPLTVRDVAELLHARYAIITGGRTVDNYAIITFPDLGTFCSLSDEDYKKLMLYLTSVPTMHEDDLGFVLVVDRRNDKWSAVKTVLLKISGFFPGLIQLVFVLRPLGFFQKAISEVSNKFFKEEFKFKLVVCSNVDELHEHIEPTQLTPDLGGTVAYCHEDWIEQRVAVEKFSTNLREISSALREMTARLRETELPNDVDSTRCLLEDQGGEYRELKDDIRSAARHGETLLSCIRQPVAITSHLDLCPDRLINVTAVERLLVQLEETEKGFDSFWSEHEKRLSQCLELRKFEYDFKELQANLVSSLKELRKIPEAGDSVAQVDCLLTRMQRFKLIIEEELARAEMTRKTGKDLIAKKHYAIDSISPKCVELRDMIADMRVEVDRKIDILNKFRDLQQRIEKANRWCAKGVDVLASQQIEKCTSSEFSEVALKELDEFLDSSKDFRLSDPREFHAIFKDVSMTPETRALVQQVLKRVEDVQMMCEQRRSSLQKLIAKPIRPIQAVVPEPAVPLSLTTSACNGSSPNPASGGGGATTDSSRVGSTTLPRYAAKKSPDTTDKKLIRKAKTVPKMQIEVCLGREQPNCLPVMVNGDSGGGLMVPNQQQFNSESTSPRTGQELRDKRGHVMAELIETERAYVSELRSILTGYRKEMENPSMRELIPSVLLGKGDILFANMEDIQQFHEKVFLIDLQNCSHTPDMVGRCFVQRSDVFHKLYSMYCMNKPKSEALRRQCADDNPFFKECQRKLGHKLPLGAYLLKPVQRITKYQLLLKDLFKFSDGLAQAELQEAVDTMLDVLKYVNDSMHQIAITGFHGSLADYGKLLLQGAFNVWMERKKERIRDLKFKPSQRYIFLYEQLVLFTKKAGRDDSPSYAFKNALKTSQIGLTENVRGSRGDRRKFEVWLHGRTQVFIIQAPSNQVKDTWVCEIKKVLLQQFERMKDVSTKQYSDKPQKLAPVNGTNTHLPTVIKKSRNAIGSLSWDNCPTATNNNNRVGKQRAGELGRRATLPAFRTYRQKDEVDSCGACGESLEDGWSTDEFSNSDEDDDRDVFIDQIEIGGRFSVLGDYEAVDVGEASLHEGQTVEVQKVGGAGWWYVRVIDTGSQGWAPASYLGPAPSKRGSNTPSVSSQDSGSGSLRHAVSRSSVASNVSNTSLEGSHQVAGGGSV